MNTVAVSKRPEWLETITTVEDLGFFLQENKGVEMFYSVETKYFNSTQSIVINSVDVYTNKVTVESGNLTVEIPTDSVKVVESEVKQGINQTTILIDGNLTITFQYRVSIK